MRFKDLKQHTRKAIKAARDMAREEKKQARIRNFEGNWKQEAKHHEHESRL